MSKFIYVNKFWFLGIIGAIIILFGYTQMHPQAYYIIGSLTLLVTAIHYQLVYFIALEIILIAGHSAILLQLGYYTQIALPTLLSFQLFIFFIISGKDYSIYLLIGIIGIAFHSLGFAYNNQWIFFCGSSCIAIYSYYNGYKGRHPSYIWAILNTIFSILSLYNITFR